MSTTSVPQGAGLFEVTREHAGRAVTNILRLAGSESRPGRGMVNTATLLLGVLAAGLFAVSLTAQYRYVIDAKHQTAPAIIEALALDAGMVIFSLLALGLARGGQSARIERALIVVCAFGSAGMNYAAADITSPRSVAAYTMPPVFLAIVTDRVIAVVRRHVLGMNAERSAWAAIGRAGLTVVVAAGKTVLYGLRLILAPKSTLGGVRRCVLLATPLPAASPVPLAVLPPAPGPAPGNDEVPEVCERGDSRDASAMCGRARPCPRHEPEVRAPGETKKAHLARLYAAHREHGTREAASRAASELAPYVQLSEGTARAYIYSFLNSGAEGKAS